MLLYTSPSVSPNCSCRVHDYSFWIGLLIPFGIIYIMNWVVFILIFGSLLCRPNVRMETSSNVNLRKLKENFMIAVGLSLLFGIGWAVGLLASSDLPDAVRYPAEWIFTLMAAFLGVYLFTLHVLRSQEARTLWKRWLLCQRKRKRGVSMSSNQTQSRNRFRTFSSILSSRMGTLKDKRVTLRDSSNTLSLNEDRSTTNTMSGPRTITGCLQPINLELLEKMAPEEWVYNKTFSPEPSIAPSEVGGKVTLSKVRDRRSGQKINADDSVGPVAEELTNRIDPEAHPSYHFPAVNLLQVNINALPSQLDPNLSATDGKCYIVENKQTEGSDITPL